MQFHVRVAYLLSPSNINYFYYCCFFCQCEIGNLFLLEDNRKQFGPVMNISWNQANEICAIHNTSLLSFSSYNDVLILQALLVEILNGTLPLPVFLGLKKDSGVSDNSMLTF